MWVQSGCGLWLSIWGGGRAHWEHVVRLSGLSAPLVVCSLPLSALSLCACRVACKYGSISRFKGVFRGFYMFGVGLCCLRALRGLWGFCARVELGGFGA